jgi:GntR family transcriptional regulator, transcriptional repressor for pyruvate dehydrogenase complex
VGLLSSRAVSNTAEGSDRTGMFSAVSRAATLSEKVAEQITQAIMDGTLAPGERLQSERDLAEQFGVSRTVIREVARSLVASGLVEARSGRGLQVAEVGPEVVSRAMGLFLHRSSAIDYPRIHEVRAALEVSIAGYAAQRASTADIAHLQDLAATLTSVVTSETSVDVQRAAELDVAFHRALAQATHNELFLVLLDSVGEVLLEIRRRAFELDDVRRYAAQAHHEILEQVANGDADAARNAMRRHLTTSAEIWATDPLAGDGRPLYQPARD